MINHLNCAGVYAPYIVKPQVACGVESAHKMALVLHIEGFREPPQVALPACVSRFVDHGGVLHKVHVAGTNMTPSSLLHTCIAFLWLH